MIDFVAIFLIENGGISFSKEGDQGKEATTKFTDSSLFFFLLCSEIGWSRRWAWQIWKSTRISSIIVGWSSSRCHQQSHHWFKTKNCWWYDFLLYFDFLPFIFFLFLHGSLFRFLKVITILVYLFSCFGSIKKNLGRSCNLFLSSNSLHNSFSLSKIYNFKSSLPYFT